MTPKTFTNFLNVYHQYHHDDYLYNLNISVSESFRTLNVKNNRGKKKDNSEQKIFLSELSVKNYLIVVLQEKLFSQITKTLILVNVIGIIRRKVFEYVFVF